MQYLDRCRNGNENAKVKYFNRIAGVRYRTIWINHQHKTLKTLFKLLNASKTNTNTFLNVVLRYIYLLFLSSIPQYSGQNYTKHQFWQLLPVPRVNSPKFMPPSLSIKNLLENGQCNRSINP